MTYIFKNAFSDWRDKMYNVSVEQIIKTKPPKMALLFKIIMVIACILAATTIPSTYVLGLMLLVVFVVCTVLLFKYYDAEYEYSLTDGELTVDKIMARTMRKRCGVYNISKAVLAAAPGSQDALRMEYKQLRTSDYTANDGSDGVVVVYTYDTSNEMVRIFIQPDEKMLGALSEAMPKGTFKVEMPEKQQNDE